MRNYLYTESKKNHKNIPQAIRSAFNYSEYETEIFENVYEYDLKDHASYSNLELLQTAGQESFDNIYWDIITEDNRHFLGQMSQLFLRDLDSAKDQNSSAIPERQLVADDTGVYLVKYKGGMRESRAGSNPSFRSSNTYRYYDVNYIPFAQKRSLTEVAKVYASLTTRIPNISQYITDANASRGKINIEKKDSDGDFYLKSTLYEASPGYEVFSQTKSWIGQSNINRKKTYDSKYTYASNKVYLLDPTSDVDLRVTINRKGQILIIEGENKFEFNSYENKINLNFDADVKKTILNTRYTTYLCQFNMPSGREVSIILKQPHSGILHYKISKT